MCLADHCQPEVGQAPGAYTWTYTVASFDVDISRQLRLSTQLKLQQEVGELHLRENGFPYAYLYDELGVVFVLTRASSVRYRAPIFGEKVQITTWSRGLKGAQYTRCYRFCDQAGEILIDSVTTFALIDAKTHALIRPSTISAFQRFVHLPQRENTCPRPGKIILPEEMELADIRKLYDSDMDYNGHLNNTIYADFISDYMPGGMRDKILTGFQIHFAGEARMGQSLEIAVAGMENKAYFTGRHTDGLCFEAACTFKLQG